MIRHSNLRNVVVRTLICFAVLLLSFTGGTRSAFADQLQPITGAIFDGRIITWKALDTAVGYNIYRDFRYVDTVTAGTAYAPDVAGEYRIVGFDGNGSFSPLQVIESDIVPTSNIAIVEFINKPIAPPQNVAGTVYSDSAGEIQWDRETTRILSYTVTLNGVQLGSTNGTSFWVTSLQANTQNLMTVTASMPDGPASEAISLVFDTRSPSFPVPATEVDSDIPAGTVVPPQNARLDVYSLTAAELFWDRPAALDGISNTEVYRNGKLIGASPGNSYFDDTRSPNTVYTYELIAIDVNGMRSAPAFINPGPFDNSDESVAIRLLTGISEVTNSNPHVENFPFISALRFGSVPDDIVELSVENTVNDGAVITRTVYECNDGSLSIEQLSGFTTITDILFDFCSTNQILIDGVVSIFSEGGLFETVDYLDLTFFGDEDVTIRGNVTSSRARAFDSRTITYNAFEYYVVGNLIDETGLDTNVVLDQTIAFDAARASGASSFTTNFTVSAPWTEGRTLSITTNETFSGTDPNDSNYIVGSLEAVSGNGESLSLIADTGDFTTWFAELSDRNGTRGITGQWSDQIRLPCIVSNSDCH